ncbi:MAG: hypothetical protein RQ872_06260 [Sulfolobaceae archaeon]|nr:hypothetical protein [Sulfolobaceae archaeon]
MSYKTLRPADYILWFITILIMFFIFEAIGDFGNLPVSSASPVSLYEKQLFEYTYIAAGGVFAIFMGSLVFLAGKFRESPPSQAKQKIDYTAISLVLLIIAGGVLVYSAIPYFSPYLPLQLQFNMGILIAMAMLLLFGITLVMYKEYYKD